MSIAVPPRNVQPTKIWLGMNLFRPSPPLTSCSAMASPKVVGITKAKQIVPKMALLSARLTVSARIGFTVDQKQPPPAPAAKAKMIRPAYERARIQRVRQRMAHDEQHKRARLIRPKRSLRALVR